MRKPSFCICENKAKLISAFVFATRKVYPLYFLNLKFQASSHPLWLYGPICVGFLMTRLKCKNIIVLFALTVAATIEDTFVVSVVIAMGISK